MFTFCYLNCIQFVKFVTYLQYIVYFLQPELYLICQVCDQLTLTLVFTFCSLNFDFL